MDNEANWEGELSSREEYAQHVYASLAPVLAQFGQVEEGLAELLVQDATRRGGTAEDVRKLERLTFGKALREGLEPLVHKAGLGKELAPALELLARAVDARNRLMHGRIHIGVARSHPEAPLEPVIVIVFHRDTADELDVDADMDLALRAMDALADVAVALAATEDGGDP